RACAAPTSAFRSAQRGPPRRPQERVLARELDPRSREAIQMPWRPARFGRFPTRLEQLVLRHAHENGIQRAGLEPRVPADVIAVTPAARALREKRIEHLQGLRRQPQWGCSHDDKNSTYVEFSCQGSSA